MRYFHLPRIDTSPLLCTVCQKLVQGEWYEELEHHGSLSALERSSLSCPMCFLAYHKLNKITILMIRSAAKIRKTDAGFQRIPDAKLDIVWGERRPRIHLHGHEDVQAFYPSEVVFSLKSKDAAQRNSDAEDLGKNPSIYPKITFTIKKLSSIRLRLI